MSTKTTDNDFTIRLMRQDDVEETFNELIGPQGWTTNQEKFVYMYAACPQYFYIAVRNNYEIVGTISINQTFPNEYYLGNFVVKKTYRGRGLGHILLAVVLDAYPKSAISLSAMPDAVGFYKKRGFRPTNSYLDQNVLILTINRDLINELFNMADNDVTVRDYDPAIFEKLLAYDEEIRGYRDTNYMSMKISCFSVLWAETKDSVVVGSCSVYESGGLMLLDGLFADSDAIACQLIAHAVDHFPHLDTMKMNVPPHSEFFLRLGQVKSSYTLKSYSIGSPTPVNVYDKIYCFSGCDYMYP